MAADNKAEHRTMPAITVRLPEANEPGIVKDEALAILAHDIRSSLAVIRGFTTTLLVRDEVLTAGERRISLEAIMRHVGVLSDFAEDVLDAARADEGMLRFHFRPTDLDRLVCDAVEHVRMDDPDHRYVVVGSTSSVVRADPRRVAQVLANLLGNARKHAPGGSQIEVRCSSGPRGARIEVVDHGPGFPDQIRPMLFQKFARLPGRAVENGLGLYLCKVIVEAHGGAVWASGDHGGAFGFTLPVAREPSAPADDAIRV